MRFLLAGFVAALLAGCGAPPPPPPPVLELGIAGSAGQNPDRAGVAQPVALRLYQLAATPRFSQADAFALIDRDQATLGPDALASETVFVAPSQTLDLKRNLKPGTQALGVLALFQDIDHATWRATAPVAASGPTRLALAIGPRTITLAQPPQAK